MMTRLMQPRTIRINAKTEKFAAFASKMANVSKEVNLRMEIFLHIPITDLRIRKNVRLPRVAG